MTTVQITASQVKELREATQAGIFEAANIPAEQLDPLLGIVCPTMLYPYLRANVADLINRTSLPPLHLTEVNFQSLYEQRLQQLADRAWLFDFVVDRANKNPALADTISCMFTDIDLRERLKKPGFYMELVLGRAPVKA